MMFIKVIKRSGKKVNFNADKIKKAIKNVFDEFPDVPDRSEALTHIVVDKVKKQYEEPHVEQIQDIVENVLMEEDYVELAKAYILYREKHAQARKEWLKGKLPLSIWTKKYQFKGETFEEFFDRVAGDNETVRKYIKQKAFIPAGRILANRGLTEYGLKVTYSNCYVTIPPEDNLESIIDAGKRIARTFSYGGGSGIDISKLRPKGSKVNNAAKTTSGSTSFLNIYDEISKTIGQKGRRAALMISLNVDHPDIEDFIDKKLDLDAVTKANMSVKVTDDFMESVGEESEFVLQFYVEDTGETILKPVDASSIFNKLAYANWYMAEPGCLFWDRIKSWNLLSEYDNFQYAGTNPCGEEPLPAGGSCNLGAINLTKFVDNPYTEKASFNFNKFSKVVRAGVTYLNDILDEGMDLHPLKSQRDSVKNWRQIGLGQMGLGSALIMLGYRYGSTDALWLCNKLGHIMINAALQQSANLAKKDGPFPMYSEEDTLKSSFLNTVADEGTILMIKRYGLRNSQLLTIAPTGSISNLVEVSGGIEPIFKVQYKRKTETLHNEDVSYNIFDKTVQELMEVKGIENVEDLPDYVVDAHSLNYIERIEMQSVWQMYVDASISSTINLSSDTTVNDIKNLYQWAWKGGLKGVTVYRDGCAREGILSGDSEKAKKVEMTAQDFIDEGICPECNANLEHKAGCKDCSQCGFSVCV